jgi:hypothetical protein
MTARKARTSSRCRRRKWPWIALAVLIFHVYLAHIEIKGLTSKAKAWSAGIGAGGVYFFSDQDIGPCLIQGGIEEFREQQEQWRRSLGRWKLDWHLAYSPGERWNYWACHDTAQGTGIGIPLWPVLAAGGLAAWWVRRRHRARLRRGGCLKCGYDLGGLDVPRCPECGTTRSANTVEAWQSRAGEEHDQ